MLPPYLRGSSVSRPIATTYPHIGLPDTLDLRLEGVVCPGARTSPIRIVLLGGMALVARRGNLQNFADRLDPAGVTVLVDEAFHYLSLRPGSAWAKKVLASLRISLAWRSTLTSRSSSFTRYAFAVVTPSRAPVLTSTRLTHLLSVCGTQTI